MSWRIDVDIGGTFTDVVLVDESRATGVCGAWGQGAPHSSARLPRAPEESP